MRIGRFGQMFRGLLPCDVSDDAIDELVAWMGDPNRPQAANLRIPAGFTYLGQFIDHDITFDPTSKLDRAADPEALVNFRTPRLDLDSLYGAGPAAQPFLYDWKDSKFPAGTRLLEGKSNAHGQDPIDDLPRNDQGRALIGDARNDENALISQLHLLFIRFHNAVVAFLDGQGKPKTRDELLDEAQQLVRRHYQWVIVHEFLPLVVGDKMAAAVLPPPAKGAKPHVVRRFFNWRGEPFIPVEFSGAAYRFGHSMVRAEYRIQAIPQSFAITKMAEPTLALSPDLEGFDFLKSDRVIAWDRFFRLPRADLPPQSSLRIDTAIAKPLFQLRDQDPQELPRRNLERGRILGLPSGQDVAAVMHEQPLTEEELQLEHLPGAKKELKAATPLWYYLLCETSRAVDPQGRPRPGRHLGPVGGRLVAEVIAGLLEADRNSYLHEEGWRPTLGENDTFTMADLVKIAQDGVA